MKQLSKLTIKLEENTEKNSRMYGKLGYASKIKNAYFGGWDIIVFLGGIGRKIS